MPGDVRRILREDEGNEEASLMLAELMFRKGHAETAIYHFQDLLEKNPGNYRALAQLVQLLRRAGRLDEASRFLKMAETASDNAAHRAGFHFAKGLERRHSGETQEALGHLNRCRADHEWGADAAYEMVDIYISPENQSMWQNDKNRRTRPRQPSTFARRSSSGGGSSETRTEAHGARVVRLHGARHQGGIRGGVRDVRGDREPGPR